MYYINDEKEEKENKKKKRSIVFRFFSHLINIIFCLPLLFLKTPPKIKTGK
jgi:hypothetical protein